MPDQPGLAPEVAFERVREELLAIEPRDFLRINVDVGAAAFTVMGAESAIRAHRAELVALFGEQAGASIDRLDLIARAVLHAQAAHQGVETGVEVNALSKRVANMREVLITEARALIARNVLRNGSIRELNGSHGFQNQCFDVLQLVSLMKAEWDVVEPETGLTMDYVDQASATATALAKAVGARSLGSRSPAAEMRQRAFTSMVSTYDDVRRMVSYLRWKEDDVDQIAPSVFRGRGGRGRSKAKTDVAPPTDGLRKRDETRTDTRIDAEMNDPEMNDPRDPREPQQETQPRPIR